MPIRYATVCSGVESMSLAVDPLGWEPVFFSEIEPFPCAVLAHHWPQVPNLGDMTKIEGEKYHGAIDILGGGTPCQSFSVAGNRAGTDDPRGQLMYEFARLAHEIKPRWLLWENVPGVLSQDGGQAFASLLSCLSGRAVEAPNEGWGNAGVVEGRDGCFSLAWRVLDAQYVRVDGFPGAIPQRRRRVWLVGHSGGDHLAPAKILFEPAGLCGDTPPRRSARQGDSAETSGGAGGSCTQFGDEFAGTLIARQDSTPCVDHGSNMVCIESKVKIYPLNSMTFGKTASDNDRQCLGIGEDGDPIPTIQAQHHHAVGIFFETHDGSAREADVAPTLDACCRNGPQSKNAAGIVCFENHAQDSRVKDCGDLAPTLHAKAGTGGGNLPLVLAHGQGDATLCENHSPTLTCNHEAPICLAGSRANTEITEDFSPTLKACHDYPICLSGNTIDRAPENGGNGSGWSEGVGYTLTAMDRHAVASGDILRRLTPLECERLMGFPDGHTDIPGASDSARYKACGNSWAVNCARWICNRINDFELNGK